MSITAVPTINGKSQRKSLASEIDRLDAILDGLDAALAGAITDAVKQAVSVAVSEAVRATLLELANPEVLAALRGPAVLPFPGTPEATSTEAPAPAAAPASSPSFIHRSWNWIWSKLQLVGQVLSWPVRKAGEGLVRLGNNAKSIWQRKHEVIVALAAGVLVGVAVGWAGAPWLSGVVSGIGATGSALGAQLIWRVRRLYAALPAFGNA